MLQIIPPEYSVYPVWLADSVFVELNRGRINGRAVFRVFSETLSDEEVMESDDIPLSNSNPDYTLTQPLST